VRPADPSERFALDSLANVPSHFPSIGVKSQFPSIGVKQLMTAILKESIRAYHGGVARHRQEAARWMADEKSEWVFSFAVICETLGLDPAAVRCQVVRGSFADADSGRTPSPTL